VTEPDFNSATESLAERYFLDANAGLPTRPEALENFLRVERTCPGNPSSLHRRGRRAQGELEVARSQTARLLGCQDSELVFTGGATEACNLALLGMVRGQSELLGRKLRLLASPTEHPAVLGPLRLLQQQGHSLQWLKVGAHGEVDPAELQTRLATSTEPPIDLIALQWANNETGALQPLQALVEVLPSAVLWFCDAVQGFGKATPPDALTRADSLVVSGHKFGAPKGVGAWVLREDAPFEAPAAGGGQQAGRRPGTETPALAVALATALSAATAEQPEVQAGWEGARKQFLQSLQAALPTKAQENHPEVGGLANTINLSFHQLDGRLLLPAFDAEGLELSSGAACASGSPTPSSVLLAIGMPENLAKASIRISLPPFFPRADAAMAAERIAAIIRRIYEVGNR
jgi:cysteine desulfurase